MSEVTLLPCPFCGGTALREAAVENTGGNRRFMWCLACSTQGPWSDKTKNANAEQQWNRRSALSQEAVRDEALDEAANELERAFAEADTLNLLHGAARVRALKREPNAAAESYESAHPKALDEPAPAAPYVDRFYGPQDPGFWAAVSDRRFSNEYIGIALRGWLDAQSPKDARSLR